MFGSCIFDYDLKVELRSTPTSIIHLARVRNANNGFVVIKQYRTDKSKDENTLQSIENEISTMRQLSHPNILVLAAAFVQGSDIFMVHPCIKYGSCQDVMDRFCVVGFPEAICSLIAKDILHALDYLHRKGYVHRSVRASHILLDDRAILTGFKECVNLMVDGKRIKKLHNLPISPKELVWLAPEVLEQNLAGYTENSDIYSFGIALCELANNLTPFAEMATTLMLTEKMKGNQPSLLDSSTYTVEMMEGLTAEELQNFASTTRQIYSQRKLSDAFHGFVEICLQRDTLNRPSAEKLLNHPFIKESKFTTLKAELDELKIDTLDKLDLPRAEAICNSFGEMKIDGYGGGDFDWDFGGPS